VIIGQPINRTDGVLKVTGAAPYAADFKVPGLVHAVMVTSTIASGTVKIDAEEVEKMLGVLLVLTHANAPKLPKIEEVVLPATRMLSLCQDDKVHYSNQPIAVVVATTLERATEAANKLSITYTEEEAVLEFDSADGYTPPPQLDVPPDTKRGDFEEGFEESDVQIDEVYTTPIENHNPIETLATLAQWDGQKLVLHDTTQGVHDAKKAIAKALGIEASDVRELSPYLGGGFGCKGSTWSHVILCATVAKMLDKPVRLVVTRPQMFGPVGYRPNTEQHVKLGATKDGVLTAMSHTSYSTTSMLEDWTETCCEISRILYDVPNQVTAHRLVKLNIGNPTFMRAPGAITGSFALESAMDELSYALKMCPVELRLKNYAEKDPDSGNPWSSKFLNECYSIGASKFGWDKRQPKPRTLREGRKLIGMGMATATYPGNRGDASAKVIIRTDGTAVVGSGTHDLGTGTYTVMTQVAAQALGFTVDNVTFLLGDSALPKSPDASGSKSAASISPAVYSACAKARQKLIALAVKDKKSPVYGKSEVVIENGWIISKESPVRRDSVKAVMGRSGTPIEASANANTGDERDEYSFHSFGAVFVEAHVDADLGTICIPRVVAVYDVGRILNQKTAHSQMMGGITWGIGAALEEETIFDTNCGHFVNANLADYHVPVNLDIGDLDITFLNKPDPHISSMGVRGVGEIGITGIVAAIANAVYNATGVRVRDLPITMDKIILPKE